MEEMAQVLAVFLVLWPTAMYVLQIRHQYVTPAALGSTVMEPGNAVLWRTVMTVQVTQRQYVIYVTLDMEEMAQVFAHLVLPIVTNVNSIQQQYVTPAALDST